MRRRMVRGGVIRGVLAGSVLLLAGALGAAVPGQDGGRTVEVLVKKFEFVPPEITLRKGEPVRLALTSFDRRHGFTVPELGIRADVEADQTLVVRVVPARAGRFAFQCD